jgi:hypothetical protein
VRPDPIGLQAKTLDWLSRLPLLGAYDLGLLLGIPERDASRLLYNLETLHWVEAVTAPSPELDAERFYALSTRAVTNLAARLGLAEAELEAQFPVSKREVMLRVARVETTVGLNRLAAELAEAARNDREIELGDFRSLPRRRAARAFWPPEVEGFGWLRSGSTYAPFFVAWDRAAAPNVHRRKRVSAWYAFREAEHVWGRDDIPPILVLCPSEAEIAQWAQAVLASADRRVVRPVRVLLSAIDEVVSKGPFEAIWRRVGGTVRAPLAERLAWRWHLPVEVRSPRVSLARPVEALPPSQRLMFPARRGPLQKESFGSPTSNECERILPIVGATEKRLLEWLGYHPLLSAADLRVLLRSRGREAEPVLHNLVRMGLVDAIKEKLMDGAGEGPWYFLTRCGVQVLAARDGVPPLRYAKYGAMAASMPAEQGGGRLGTLVRQLDHTVGINRFFVSVIRDGDRCGSVLVRWSSASEAALNFTQGGTTYWVRPDGAGDLHQQGKTRRFYLEWDRATMRWPEMRRKCLAYAQYYAWLSRTNASAIPDVLIVTTSPHREGPLWDALDRALADASRPRANIFTSVANLVDRLGPFGPVWRRSATSFQREAWPIKNESSRE